MILNYVLNVIVRNQETESDNRPGIPNSNVKSFVNLEVDTKKFLSSSNFL